MAVPSSEDILELRTDYYDYWSTARKRWDNLIDAYHGNYQKLWPGEFRRGEAPKIANWVKLGWDRYAQLCGKLPTNHIMPPGSSRKAQRRADKVEKILAHYDESSFMRHQIKSYFWYLAGLGASVIGVMPDPMMKGPRYFVKDPRTVLVAPGAHSSSLLSASWGSLAQPYMSSLSLNSAVIDETVTGTFLIDQYGHDPETKALLMKAGLEPGRNLSTPYQHITYMDKDHWVIMVGTTKILQVEHGLGFVPLRMTTVEVPDQLGGQSQFEQNIGLVLAYMRVLNQKLTYNKNIVWPWLVVKGLADIDPESRTIELFDRDGDAAFLNPPAELQAERDLDVLDRLIRVMNRDTESMQGTAPGTSNITGRAITELNRDVSNVVRNYWDIATPDLEFIKAAALAIDEELYGGMKKEMHGRAKGEQFQEEYVPKKDIAGQHKVTIDFGIGVGGLDGFVELMQTGAQGFVDEQTVMEQLPWIRSVSDTRRRVMLDRLEKLIMELTSQMAPSELVNRLVEWRKAIEQEKDPWEWLAENPLPSPQELAAPSEQAPPPGAGPVPPGAPPAIPNVPSPAQILSMVQGRR